jgi:hypothetical protein
MKSLLKDSLSFFCMLFAYGIIGYVLYELIWGSIH